MNDTPELQVTKLSPAEFAAIKGADHRVRKASKYDAIYATLLALAPGEGLRIETQRPSSVRQPLWNRLHRDGLVREFTATKRDGYLLIQRRAGKPPKERRP